MREVIHPATRLLATAQELRQASVLMLLASSHASTPACTKPSPQDAVWQELRQESVFEVLPSSHCSTPACTNPSPQLAREQPLRQESVLLELPSSQVSPASALGAVMGVALRRDSRYYSLMHKIVTG